MERTHASFLNLVTAVCSRESFYQTKPPVEFQQKKQMWVELLKQLLRAGGGRGRRKEEGAVRPSDKFGWGGRPGSSPAFFRSHPLSLEKIILQQNDPVYLKVHKKIMVLWPAQHSVHMDVCFSVASL